LSGFLPYGRQAIDPSDVAAVVAALQSDYLTTGPMVARFEEAFARFVGARHAVAVTNGTAALHAAYAAVGIGPGDEVIVPAMTFAATANAACYLGARPVFADVASGTLLLDHDGLDHLVTERTKAIVAVDYAGQPCAYPALRAFADKHGLALVADACHALGGSLDGRPVGSLADLSTFSLHPVKPMTTGEGGVVTTDDPDLAERMRVFRNHGITTDHRQREQAGTWHYDMVGLGFNYRLSDLHCALGLSQLARLPAWVSRRRELAARYGDLLAGLQDVRPLEVRLGVGHGWHLMVVRLMGACPPGLRDAVLAGLRARGIGANVHYKPVHLHAYYREQLGTRLGMAPVSEDAFARIVTLPLFPAMEDADVDRVVGALGEVLDDVRR
jgi:perosamine synthetase